jgi:hypothetical protein
MNRGKQHILKRHFTPFYHGLAEDFFCGWSKKCLFLHRPTGQREHGSECHHKKQPQLLNAALHDNAIIKKIAGKFPVHIWG